MNLTGKLNYAFRKSPLLRVLVCSFFIGIILGTFFLMGVKNKLVPEITSIVPPVGSPGDVIVIYGKNFGKSRDMNYVEIAGSKLTSSSYISWSDDCIKLILPANVQDGLLFVGTRKERSKPALFANEMEVPVPVPPVAVSSKPVISYILESKVDTGEIITIIGNNFGDTRNQSKVFFTIDYNNKIARSEIKPSSLYTENMICANDDDYDYILWSNNEIRVRVPDGACTGLVLVDNGKEKSEPKSLTINQTVGHKEYKNRKIFLVQYTADVAEIVTNDASTITLRCPIPFTTPYQPAVEITEVEPPAVLNNYQHNLIHQLNKNKNYIPKSVFKQTFVLAEYEINTFVDAQKVGLYKKMSDELYTKTTRADDLIPSDNETIRILARNIIGKEKNVYLRAKLIYDYMCKNYTILSEPVSPDSSPMFLLSTKKGDALDFAVIYTALLRSLGIPAITDGGILVAQDLATKNHWWCEFYIDGLGWIPVDVALGAGLDFTSWASESFTNAKDYYFGNLDSNRIIFSRGWNQLKPFSADNKIVQFPRSFALQSIWEEASSCVTKYSSYWSVPVIKGLY